MNDSIQPKYKKYGNVVIGMPFKDGSFGIKVVKDYIRIKETEPILVYKRLSANEKAEIVA